MNDQLQTGQLLHGDCCALLAQLAPASVDFILTDPPYLVRYRSRDGQTVANDDNDQWLKPAFSGMYRALKDGGFCVSFYGWNKVDLFMSAWKAAGFRVVGHLVFQKPYASSSRFLRHEHEQAYLLAKGNAVPPAAPLSDVRGWVYTRNRLHPTQKPTRELCPLVEAFTAPGDVVLDPFCGSGSTLMAAARLGRRFIGMELDERHFRTTHERLERAGLAH